MPVQFIFGRAGAGKSSFCQQQIRDLIRQEPFGRPIWLIVPKQHTFETQRRMACEVVPEGFTRLRVVSFDLLAAEVVGSSRFGAARSLSPAGRRLLLGDLLLKMRDDLRFFGAVATQSGVAAELDSVLAELSRAGVDPGMLASAEESIHSSVETDQQLADKLHDLRILALAYEQRLQDGWMDAESKLRRLREAAEGHQLLAGAEVFVDGFLEYSAAEIGCLSALSGEVKSLWITVLADCRSPTISDPHHIPSNEDVFRRPLEAYRQAYFATSQRTRVLEPIRLEGSHRFKSGGLLELEQIAATWDRTRFAPGSCIRLAEGADPRAEVSQAAAWIRQAVRDGMRYREISVLARDLTAYHGAISGIFAEYGIPHFTDERRKAAHHPIVQTVQATLGLLRGGDTNAHVETLLRAGLVDLNRTRPMDLLRFARVNGVSDKAWVDTSDWRFMSAPDDSSSSTVLTTEQADAARRRLLEPLQLIGNATDPGAAGRFLDLCELVFKALQHWNSESLVVDWTAKAHESGRVEEALIHEQAWREVVEFFEEAVELLGDGVYPRADAIRLLEAGLGEMDLAIVPPTLDQVLVGSIPRTRDPGSRMVIVLGMSEAQFPRRAAVSGGLTRLERHQLQATRIELDGTDDRDTDRENLLAYLALTRASEVLCITRPLTMDEQPVNPGRFWSWICARLQGVTPAAVSHTFNRDLGEVHTPHQLVAALLERRRPGAAPAAKSVREMSDWLFEQQSAGKEPFRGLYDMVWPVLRYRNLATLSAESVALLYPEPDIVCSITALEAMAACPFQHFARQTLRLREPVEARIGRDVEGSLAHKALELLLPVLAEARASPDSDPTQAEQVEKALQKAAATILGTGQLEDPRTSSLLRRMHGSLLRLIQRQAAINQVSALRPRCAEFVFGPESPASSLQVRLDTGKSLLLRGRIDRVDVDPEDRAFVVVDYKRSAKTLSRDQLKLGLSLQLVAYMLALADAAPRWLRNARPAGAMYFPSHDPPVRLAHPSDREDTSSTSKTRPRGLLNQEFLALLDGSIGKDHLKSEVFQIAINKSDGAIASKCDLVDREVFERLLDAVREHLRELGTLVARGEVSVSPYKLKRVTPCATCAYRSVCRFERVENGYRVLQAERDVSTKSSEGEAG
jgi:ATP-dependent helicase/nuclease subunit B